MQVTTRELEVAELISFGATEKEISSYLHLAVDTVKVHKKHLFMKTGCRNITDVTRWFFQRRIGITLCPSPAVSRFISAILLAIILSAEAFDMQFLRPRTNIRSARRVATARVRIRSNYSRKNYLLTA